MKRLLVLLAGALLLALVVAGAAAAGPARTCPSAPHQVTTFSPGDWGAFAGGMAADSHGKLFVSQTTWAESNIGEVWKVAPNGDKSLAGTMDLGPNGMLVGVAVDRLDRVYVAFVDFGDPQTVGGGVYCVGPGGTMTMKVSLPADTFTFPNGLAIHRDRVYITDSATGAVWCSKLGNGVAKPADPWVQDALLAPGDPADPEMRGMGANGIAFQGECLFVNVSDYGRIVRIRVKDNGSPGVPSVICERPELKTADNMAFDALGVLWIATDTGTTGASPGDRR